MATSSSNDNIDSEGETKIWQEKGKHIHHPPKTPINQSRYQAVLAGFASQSCAAATRAVARFRGGTKVKALRARPRP